MIMNKQNLSNKTTKIRKALPVPFLFWWLQDVWTVDRTSFFHLPLALTCWPHRRRSLSGLNWWVILKEIRKIRRSESAEPLAASCTCDGSLFRLQLDESHQNISGTCRFLITVCGRLGRRSASLWGDIAVTLLTSCDEVHKQIHTLLFQQHLADEFGFRSFFPLCFSYT